MKRKWINILLFGFITIPSTAQTDGYKFYSKLDSVKISGFYNIELTPEMTARLKTDYCDLRIVNEAGKWIPHILYAPAYEMSSHPLIIVLKFSLTENSKANTSLLIESFENASSNFGLIITNTAAKRFCTLSGSDDKENWFIINDSIALNPILSEKNGSETTFRIDFPPTSYRFYKIVIHNNNKDPFNIKRVVEYSSAEIRGPRHKLISNPLALLQQKDSGKISYIKITQQQPYQFDHISLQITGVKYYNRKVDLYIPYTDIHSFANPGQLLQSFTVSNNSTLKFDVPITKSSVFYLEIKNEDNLPLTVQEVKPALSNHYLTTYLEAGSNYQLIMGNEAAAMPNYDLLELNTNMPDSIPSLGFGKVTAAKEDAAPVTVEKNNKWMLWAAIAAALLILLFFSYKMLKEVDKRKSA